jgi:WS/DGAT/MGAT family acyltransferase
MQRVSPVDAAWLALESRDTPMHVGALFEFSLPPKAPDSYLEHEFEKMRRSRAVPPPWNLKLVQAPLLGSRLPLMQQIQDVDLDYHVRHSALPHPGGQRELGVLVSRLHSHQLDLHRPLWEVHLIEGLQGGRFAMYSKMHHSLVDGVSGMRLIMRTLSRNPTRGGTSAFWTVGAGAGPSRGAADHNGRAGMLGRPLHLIRDGAAVAGGLSRAALDLGMAALDDRALQAPYRAPQSVLGESLGGQRRFATQQYEFDRIKRLARATDGTVNDIVLHLSGTALRHYLLEHARLPDRPLTAGIPVNLRDAEDQSMGTAIGVMIAELGTHVADPLERLAAIQRSTRDAKAHLSHLPATARTSYTLLLNGPYIAGLLLGLAGHAPVPFNVGVSNVPGPPEPLFMNGSRLEALFPLSLLMHGNALNITCVSYAGTLNFGFTGARDTMPHLQRLAIYMGEALQELERLLHARRGTAKRRGPATRKRPAARKPPAPTKRQAAAKAPAARASKPSPKTRTAPKPAAAGKSSAARKPTAGRKSTAARRPQPAARG